MERWLNKIINADCLDVMRKMSDNTIDAIVTDPPYGLKFMGKEWDHGVPGVDFWKEALRVCKPGAHMLAFGGTRTHHRLMVAIEDAGWEIRDCLGWLYGSGFPKSLDVSKAIDKAAGATREIICKMPNPATPAKGTFNASFDKSRAVITAPSTDQTKIWQGWGTALKPAWEPIVLARKPLDGPVAENVQKWGVGAINVDGCRIPTTEKMNYSSSTVQGSTRFSTGTTEQNTQGRFPANIIHDGSEEVMEVFPDSKGQQGDLQGTEPSGTFSRVKSGPLTREAFERRNDSGSAARFFYCAKASPSERGKDNTHATVKPMALMKYLIKLITPEGGIVMDPFAGSGTTGLAAIELRVHSVSIEKEGTHVSIIEKRVDAATRQTRLFHG